MSGGGSASSVLEPNSSCATLYDGVILEPYAWMIVSTLLFMILQEVTHRYLVPYCLDPCLIALDARIGGACGCHYLLDVIDFDRLERTFQRNSNQQQQQQQNKDDAAIAVVINDPASTSTTTATTATESKKTASCSFLLFQVLAATASCIVANFSLEKSTSITGFYRYQDYVGLLVNSCVVTTFVSCNVHSARLHYEQTVDMVRFDPQSVKRFKHVVLLGRLVCCMILIPVAVTHLIPACFMYCWFVALICLALYVSFRAIRLGASFIMSCLSPTDAKKLAYTLQHGAIAEFFTRLWFVFFFTTLTNYAALLYALPNPITGHAYLSVISNEYSLRTETECFLSSKTTESIAGVLVLFNWL